jgi:hypothetical protein
MNSKTKTIVMLVLLVVNIGLAIGIYKLIIGDVRKQAKIEKIDDLVIDKLKVIRNAQVAYRQMNGKFAPDFPTLISGMKNGRVAEYKKSGDKDKDPNAIVRLDTIYTDAMEYVFKSYDYPVDKLGLVPPADTATFIMATGNITKNAVTLPTFEVKDPYPFNPSRTLKVGSLDDAIDFGNWK